MQSWVVFCWALLVLVGAHECPDGGRCKEGQTCCNSPTNDYKCCPFDQAECCEDHIHCCPADTVCDKATSSCVNKTVSIPWKERTSADHTQISRSFRMIRTSMDKDYETICPDESRCPAEYSCQKSLTKFGCCPVAKGVSCSDGKHCCPEGHHCSIDSRSCIQKDNKIPCDEKVACPDGTTCCKNKEGHWGCCVYSEAVCCSDKEHCCPSGFKCNMTNFTCDNASSSTPMKQKIPAFAFLAPSAVKATTQRQVTTAESVESEEISSEEAYDDDDGDEEEEEELDGNSEEKITDNRCRTKCDNHTCCPHHATCCFMTSSKKWGCCPVPKAVCCADGIHCCPAHHKCKEDKSSCTKDEVVIPWYTKIPATTSDQADPSSVKCDNVTKCHKHSSCCKLPSGKWGCCPIKNAVCCHDGKHCCPRGHICDPASKTCKRKVMEETVPLTPVSLPENQPQLAPLEQKDVVCEDQTTCPDETTCCKTSATTWACCPMPNAVCCSDMQHCCPAGTTCDLVALTCNNASGSTPMNKKIPAFVSTVKATAQNQLTTAEETHDEDNEQKQEQKDVVCDDQTACPDETTCCKASATTWACCPMPNAVCCSDMQHCCPAGTTCDLVALTCNNASGSTPMNKKIPAFASTVKATAQNQLTTAEETHDKGDEQKDVKCDEQSACPDGTTCCRTSSTTWGCCPLPNAVCCADMQHCCPAGSTCDAGQCSENKKPNWFNWNSVFANKKKAQRL